MPLWEGETQLLSQFQEIRPLTIIRTRSCPGLELKALPCSLEDNEVSSTPFRVNSEKRSRSWLGTPFLLYMFPFRLYPPRASQ